MSARSDVGSRGGDDSGDGECAHTIPAEAHGTSSKRTQQQLQPASLALPNNPSISLEKERGGGWKGVPREVRVL